MLYNKNWDAKFVTSDPFTLESLIAWLEKQPPAEPYDYFCCGGCMFHQYFTASGVKAASVAGDYYREIMGGDQIELPKRFPDIAAIEPHTFGAALTRARSALAAR